VKLIDVVAIALLIIVLAGLGYGSWLLGGFIKRTGPAWCSQLAIAVVYFGIGCDVISKVIKHYTR
jgi:hypothetical protein